MPDNNDTDDLVGCLGLAAIVMGGWGFVALSISVGKIYGAAAGWGTFGGVSICLGVSSYLIALSMENRDR